MFWIILVIVVMIAVMFIPIALAWCLHPSARMQRVRIDESEIIDRR